MDTAPKVVVVGLGPGDESFVTTSALAAIDAVPYRFLRTSRHPSAHLVPSAVAFDEVYDRAGSFADVYAEIVDRLVVAASRHGEVLYAVPGSPLVLERTVAMLRDDPRVECTIVPAMSFLDLVWARLAIDPVEAGVRLVDGHEFAVASAGQTGPLLVAHTHANWVLSEIKLAVDGMDDAPVVLLQRLGTADEQVVHTTWAELDRTVEADHLTCLYVPAMAAPVGAELVRFHELTRVLRQRCPWDREQTHRSLVRYLLEETYELVDALTALDPDDPSTDDHLVEELGDVLYQVEFHAAIAEQEGRFTMADVARTVHDKLVRRHPHVFGEVVAGDADTVVANWDAIKRDEKARGSVFEGVAMSQPSLSLADEMQRKAAKVGFDWPSVEGALPKIAEELDEVLAARAAGRDDEVAAEVGDLLFAVVNVARHLGVAPEAALRAAAMKFRARFMAVEELAAERGIELRTAGLDVLDALWQEVKT